MDPNQTIIELPPEVGVLVHTLLSLFCCVTGSWILFGQWWIEIWGYICKAKGWPVKSYSLAPGGGILLAFGIYIIPIPKNSFEWVGRFTSLIQPYWWISLVIDPFHIVAVLCIVIVIYSRTIILWNKSIPNTKSHENKEKNGLREYQKQKK